MDDDLLVTNNFFYENQPTFTETSEPVKSYNTHSFIISSKYINNLTKYTIQLPRVYERLKSLKLTNINKKNRIIWKKNHKLR